MPGHCALVSLVWSLPASRTSTEKPGSSESRVASVKPAAPPPTTLIYLVSLIICKVRDVACAQPYMKLYESCAAACHRRQRPIIGTNFPVNMVFG